MSKFTLICEDEAIPFGGTSTISHVFETDDLGYILNSMTKFLQSSGYVCNDQVLKLVLLSGLGDE